ncbi:FimV/HubP family polar landmark protein [Pseudidiomarina sp.]|uniref:FimV/HubP family polar landmark protein n=1 Tax=Pseudidiomarina sp. TaxID=2081707 RepID=UPI00299D11A5|nr:FimV/HubP family polar landmark protein [Pseudidiomarina sp.]MDX1705860.1 FimV/HubP family polar landmark protein [Pseudidiomarina sp.]
MAGYSQASNAGAVTLFAFQGQVTTRWQLDRFGPIVSSDTLWSIASYYGRQRDMTVYQMMDAIVAANPRAFINNQPDRMMNGYYLTIPGGPASDDATKAAATTDAADPAAQPVAPATDPGVVQFDVGELTALRDQLADSITLIETLQTQNTSLQDRLQQVTAELAQLKAQVNEDREVDREIAALASEIQKDYPEKEATEERIADQSQTAGSPVKETATETATETAAEVTTEAISEPVAAPVEEEALTPPAKDPVSTDFIDWLLQPFQLLLTVLIPLLLAVIFWYLLYVRRLNRETPGTYNRAVEAAARERSGGAREESPAAAAAAPLATNTEVQTEPEDEPEVEADSVAEVEESREPPIYAEDQPQEDDADAVAEVEESREPQIDAKDEPQEDEADAVAEVEARGEHQLKADEDVPAADIDEQLLADLESDFELDAEVETQLEPEIDAESVAEVELQTEPESEPEAEIEPETEAEPEPEEETAATDKTASKEETSLDDDLAGLDSFGGLKLEDEEAPEAGSRYVSIDELIDEAEASEADDDEDDPYNPQRVSDALGDIDSDQQDSDQQDRADHDDETSADESKSPAAMLDLAQAYIDMGELDDARDLLVKIVKADDDEAQRDAQQLLQQLDGQAGR